MLEFYMVLFGIFVFLFCIYEPGEIHQRRWEGFIRNWKSLRDFFDLRDNWKVILLCTWCMIGPLAVDIGLIWHTSEHGGPLAMLIALSPFIVLVLYSYFKPDYDPWSVFFFTSFIAAYGMLFFFAGGLYYLLFFLLLLLFFFRWFIDNG